MSIAVIVVNYAAADLAIAAVQSVLDRDHGGRQVEVHLVDNASEGTDAVQIESAHRDRGWAGQVTLWLEQENHGFGRGNNLVLRALAARDVPPEFVFLLNPDARLENEALDILASDLEAHPKAVASGARIALPDGTPVSAAFRWPTARSELAQAVGFGPFSRLIGDKGVALPPDAPEGPVDWVAGAAVLLRLSAVEQAGFFDPGYFLYYEEVDLMRDLTKRGGQIRYQPLAHVLHAEGASTGVQSGATERRRRPAYLYRSWRRYFSKGRSGLSAFLLAFAVWIGSAVGWGISTLRRRQSHLPLSFFGDQARYVLGPLSGLRPDPDYDTDTKRSDAMSTATPTVDTTMPDAPVVLGSRNMNPEGMGLWALLAEDFRTHGSEFLSQGFWALAWHRFGNWRMGVKPKILRAPLTVIYRVMYKITQWVCGIDLPYTVTVGRRLKLEHFGGMILIAERIGDDVTIRQNTTFGISGFGDLHGRPVIGDRVEIGTGVVICGRARVGDDVIIGANAVVRGDLPNGVVVGGVPAKILREVPAEELARRADLRRRRFG